MSDLTLSLKVKPIVSEVIATTEEMRQYLPPGFAETPLAVTAPQCGFDLNDLLYDTVGGKLEYQGGEIILNLIQRILFDKRLDPCEKTWIIKHEKKHVKENERVFRTNFLSTLKADSAFKTLTAPHIISPSTDNFGPKVDAHMNKIAARIFHVFNTLMADSARRIDSKSEYEDVDGKKKDYCGAGSSKIPKFSVIRKGNTGSDVAFAQRLLNGGLFIGALGGEALQVDGIFGSNTKARVKKLQSKLHVSSDGVVGPITWTLLMVFLPFSA